MKRKFGITISVFTALVIGVTAYIVCADNNTDATSGANKKPSMYLSIKNADDPSIRCQVNYVYKANKDKPSSSFLTKEELQKEKLDVFQVKTKNSQIKSIELKTWVQHFNEDEFGVAGSNRAEPDRMVYVVKTIYPDGLDTKAGFVPDAATITVFDAETGDFLECASGPRNKVFH